MVKLSRIKSVGAVAAVSAFALMFSACGSDSAVTSSSAAPSTASETATAEPTETVVALAPANLAGAGASAQESAQEAWKAEFMNLHPEITISYDPVGSGGGREQFLNGGVVFAGTDAAMNEEELQQSIAICGEGGGYDLPLYISPFVVIFNLDGIDELNMTPATIAKIFTGQITNWNDPEIAADNPDAALPDLAITPVHRSDESGTTKNFTDYLAATAPDVWTFEPSGTWPMEGGQSDQGTSGVISTVQGGQGTIGYADASKVGTLGTVAVQVGDEFVAFSPEGAALVVDASPLVEGRPEHDYAIKLDRTTTEPGAYPLVLISYILVCSEYEDEAVGNAVVEYIRFIASEEGQAYSATAAGSAPISDEMRTNVMAALDSIKVG